MKKFFALMTAMLLMMVTFSSCGDDGDDEPAPVAEYTIKYDPNGGTGTIANTTYKAGDKVTLSDGSGFTRDGYAFTGWSDKADGTTLDANAIANKNVTLYAVWTKIDDNGGETPVAVEVKAVFTCSPEKQVQPSMNCNFYADQVPGDDISYSWDFGDGIGTQWKNNSEFQEVCVHTYDTYGEYTITFTVRSKDKVDEAKKTIKILPAPPISISQPTKFNGVAPFTLELEESVMYAESVKYAIYRVENEVAAAEPMSVLSYKVGERQSFTFETPGTYYLNITAFGPGAPEEGIEMRVDTVVVAPVAFFPTGYDKANVAAWYSNVADDGTENKAVFLLNDGNLFVTTHSVSAAGVETKTITNKALGMQVIYALQEGSTFENGIADVGVQMFPKYATAPIVNGVLTINVNGFDGNGQYVLQDNANIPEASDPTK